MLYTQADGLRWLYTPHLSQLLSLCKKPDLQLQPWATLARDSHVKYTGVQEINVVYKKFRGNTCLNATCQ